MKCFNTCKKDLTLSSITARMTTHLLLNWLDVCPDTKEMSIYGHLYSALQLVDVLRYSEEGLW